MDTDSSSTCTLAGLAQAKLHLLRVARDTKDIQLKSHIHDIATQVDDLVRRNSRTDAGEE
jgi:hypothetical protein